MSDSRYPYTYACDFVRSHCTIWNASDEMRTPISRAQASNVMGAFELAFGMTHEEMAKKLADHALAQESA